MQSAVPPAHQPRALIWIEGSQAECQQAALRLLDQIPDEEIAWIGRLDTQPTIKKHLPGRARALLGQTLQAGVLDAHDGLDPDDLGALTGTIRGGGYCLLLSPEADDWMRRPDPAMAPLLSHGIELSDCHCHFTRRLAGILRDSSIVRHLNAREILAGSGPLAPAAPAKPLQAIHPTADQARVIEAIRTQACHNKRLRLLITADRGRGKSAALGMAIRALSGYPLRLTARSRAAATSVFQHAAPETPTFLAPERLSADESLLMIDEAAALPLGQLEAIIAENPRCILTSTVHGYEGSGQGLILRLARRLAAQVDSFHHLSLEEPVRWGPNDPLEALVNDLLLLAVEPAALAADNSPGAFEIEPLSAASLAENEPMLRDVFALLITGHYRTRPRDLRQLLDDPQMQCWRSIDPGGASSGILAARPEGGVDAELTRAIHAGQRRPPGHLIAQSLTFHAGIPDAACLRGLRIQRLAVHPQRRRQGQGRGLVTAAIASAQTQGLDWIGTSFGFTPELLEFWSACGFSPVRYGHRRDPRSGAQAVIMLKPLSAAGESLLTTAQAKLTEQAIQ